MDNVTRLLMQSSGGKKDITYVDDVFSTDLRIGLNSNTAINNGIKLGNSNAGNSVLFDNVNDYLEIAHTTDLCVGSGDFTIECWAYYRGNFESYDGLFGNWTGSGDDGYILETVGSGATTDLEFYYYNDSNTFVGPVQGGSVSKDQWNHLCVCRSGNTIRLFVNGTMHGSGTSITTGIRDGTSNFTVGGQVAAGGWWNGYITNLRVTKGQALYTSNFTPSTSELTTTSQGATGSNVKLLCCNKETVTDSTVTPGTIISKGDAGGPPTPVPFGPFTGTGGEGGMVWYKPRNATQDHKCIDTVRGVQKYIQPNGYTAEITASDMLSAFNTNGFIWGDSVGTNELVWWTFRKAKGFFDIVTWSGNATGSGSPARQIPHNLKSVPGCIMVKCTTQNQSWAVYHRGTGSTKYLVLNANTAATTSSAYWGDTDPTDTHFTVKHDGQVNENGHDYVAYVFAGGESPADTARSVDFDGTGDYLTTSTSSDYDLGTGDFTLECWIKWDANASNLIFLEHRTSSDQNDFVLYVDSDAIIFNSWSADRITTGAITNKQWYHVALVRNSATTTMYVNGISQGTYADTRDYDNEQMRIGVDNTGSYDFDGKISNVRLVKGTAVYTSAFKPPTKPLTSITNTKLLCCQSSTVTTATVGTVTSSGDPTASTDSPFDDPAGFKFGEEGDQEIIKCGKITTNTTNGAILHLPWEPQWFLYKHADANANWTILDSMRGWTADGTVEILHPNTNGAESGGGGYEKLQPRTITFQGYGNNYDFIWMAIRRPDGYVGKPAVAGTDVFAMDTGGSSSTIPNYDSGFPVDFGLRRRPATAEDWTTLARLIQGRYLVANKTDAGTNWAYATFDSNVGFLKDNDNNTYQAWMWKRGQGFDVSTYTGNGSAGHTIPHSLNKTPEMIWIKSRVSVTQWCVGHKGRNGGVNPWDYFSALNGSGADENNSIAFNDTAPTSTHFTVGGNDETANKNNFNYIAMLFASVEGISKCGNWVGDGGTQTITLGFQPRFVVFKTWNTAGGWYVLDTLRGWSAGNDASLQFQEANAQASGRDDGNPTATGFTVTGDVANEVGRSYIYYAHA